MIFVGAPAQQEVFESFSSPVPHITVFYAIAVVYIAIGFMNIFSGVKLFQDDKSEVYFNRGIAMLVVSIIALALSTAINIILVIAPIYNLTNNL